MQCIVEQVTDSRRSFQKWKKEILWKELDFNKCSAKYSFALLLPKK